MSGVQSHASATAELVLEPQVRKFSDRRWIVGALAIPALLLAAYLAVLRLSSLEQMLVADAAHASRAVLYELPRGSALAAPIEPGTEIIRLAMHAYVHDAELPLGKRRTKLHVVEEGSRGRKVEDVNVDLPGERTRVTSDEPGLSIGDPVAIDFDVHDLGAGELTVTLTGIDKADGLLVRMYRRESLSLAKASARNSLLDRQRKNHLARWTWELAWDEASASEQEEILADRWRRVGALRGSGHDLRSIAVALVPQPAESRTPELDDSLGGTTLRGDERLAFVIRKTTTLRASSDLAATLKATVRDLHGGARMLRASGELVISSTDAGDESVEIESDRDVLLNVRTSDPHRVDWFGYSQAWRASLARPILVESPETDRLLRVTIRRAVDRSDTTTVGLEAVVDVTGPTLRAPLHRVMRAGRLRSRFDRYEAFDPTEAPTERFTFFVAVPRGGRALITPPGKESLDISLAELDPSRENEPLAARALDEPPPRLEVLGADSWGGFVPRRPSNAADFDVAQRPLIRIARHFVATDAPTTTPTLIRFASGGGAGLQHDGLVFERVGPAFHAEVGGQRPLLLPFRLLGDAGTRVDVQLRPGADRRPRAGIFDRVTLPRTLEIGPGPTRATLVVGDDIPPGPLTLDVTARPIPKDESAAAGAVPATWIHLPRVLRRGSSAPRWIAGQFEE